MHRELNVFTSLAVVRRPFAQQHVCNGLRGLSWEGFIDAAGVLLAAAVVKDRVANLA